MTWRSVGPTWWIATRTKSLSKVDVSMNGIELQDREFFVAIREKREPNASVGQCYTAMQVLGKLETMLEGARGAAG